MKFSEIVGAVALVVLLGLLITSFVMIDISIHHVQSVCPNIQ